MAVNIWASIICVDLPHRDSKVQLVMEKYFIDAELQEFKEYCQKLVDDGVSTSKTLINIGITREVWYAPTVRAA